MLITGSLSGRREGMRAHRPAAAAAPSAREAPTEEARGGCKCAAPQLKDSRPSCRACACSLSPPCNTQTALADRVAAAAAASRGRFNPMEELAAAICHFRGASPPLGRWPDCATTSWCMSY
ncbi:hypothetical protein VC83_05599 [Pseudogymnoascus destructans]|uniref:Uncharacterized protein n=1 Tax=Pseudogymnoascus destructans TaxID=655981 RepID=A0A177A6S3_9PEZI|nr:uncharacterized protein VC83_05599 [Pseudogymnoascus destructans]OAF57859.1 hypothetical protein VC83_05599 [Pseudogymnoascus destructans]